MGCVLDPGFLSEVQFRIFSCCDGKSQTMVMRESLASIHHVSDVLDSVVSFGLVKHKRVGRSEVYEFTRAGVELLEAYRAVHKITGKVKKVVVPKAAEVSS